MKNVLKNILYGFLSWLIPFVSAFFFYSGEGELSVDIFLFKTIMIIVGALSGSYLMVLYFKSISNNYLKEGLAIGITWLGINIILDLVLLIPMSGMSLHEYFPQIGLRYLVIPIFSTMMGLALNHTAR